METKRFYRFLKLSNQNSIEPLIFLSIGHTLLQQLDRDFSDTEIIEILKNRQRGKSLRQIETLIAKCMMWRGREHHHIMCKLDKIRCRYCRDPDAIVRKQPSAFLECRLGRSHSELGGLISRIYVVRTLRPFSGPYGYYKEEEEVTITWEYWSRVYGIRRTIHYSWVHPNLPDEYKWLCCAQTTPTHEPGLCRHRLQHKFKTTV